jgi:hypothetical protein
VGRVENCGYWIAEWGFWKVNSVIRIPQSAIN